MITFIKCSVYEVDYSNGLKWKNKSINLSKCCFFEVTERENIKGRIFPCIRFYFDERVEDWVYNDENKLKKDLLRIFEWGNK